MSMWFCGVFMINKKKRKKMYHREFDEYDPDLEARLYGEIHHSNETYSDHVSSRSQCDSHRKTSSYDYQWAIDPMPSYDMNNSGNHRTVGLMPNYDNSQQHRSSMNYPTNNAAYSSRNFRPLMQEIVHPPGISAQYSYPSHSNPSRPPPLRQRYNNNYHNNIYIENQRPSSHRSRSNIRTSNHNIEKRSKSNQPGNTSKINKKPHVSNKNKYGPTTSKKKSNKNNTNSDQNPSKSTNSQLTIETDKNSKVNSYNFEKNDDPSKNDVPSKNDNQLENNGESISKYDVAMKSNEELQINPADEKSVSINLLSDSDESILEVPVPPKPIPLLINLQDSDDEALSNDDNDNEQSPVIMADKTKELLQTPVSPAAEEDLNLSVKIIPSTALASSESVENSVDNVSNETSVTPNNNEEYSNDNDTIANNIIINCTQVATGVTTLSDIKRLRDGVHSTSNNNILSDDDSMTESEAMKWGQIEGQMAGNKGDNSTDQIWNQFGQNTEDSVIKTTDNPVVHDSITNSIELGGNVDKTTDNGNNSRIKSNSNGSKKRMHELDSSIHEGTNDMSDHRNKRRKSTRQMSFEEYVFQPMPKKLEAFYNEPRGIMMDVHKIQNRMPNNPNRWAILDEDRGGYFQLREKKRMCSTCQREGHTHEKCPKTRPISTCHMCGKIGHQEPRCPYSMCLTCGTKFSSYRKTCENCRKSKCIICKSQGHTNNNCPDLWRRYHQTTPSNSGVDSSHKKEMCRTSLSKNRCIDEDIPIEHMNNKQLSPTESPTPDQTISSTKTEDKFTSSPSPSSSSSEAPLNGYIFFHWKSPSLWSHNLKSNYTRLNDIEGSILDGVIAGVVFPAFITELDDICPFELIMGYHNGSAQMFLQTYSDDVLELLKKLLIMWLMRDDDEKWLMIGGATLPINRRKLLNSLKERQTIARSKWSTADQVNMSKLINQLETRKAVIKDIYKSYPIVRPLDVQASLEKVEATTYDLKWRIVLCLYYCEWVKNAKETIDNFHIIMMEIERNTLHIEVSVPVYLKVLQFCNEVFTPHMSQHIIEGAQNCIKSLNKENEQNNKPWSTCAKSKIIMETLSNLMFEYEVCKQYKSMSNEELMIKFNEVENIIMTCPDNDKYIKSLESYRELLIDNGSLQQLIVILGYLCSLLQKKLQLSDLWRENKLQKIRQALEDARHLNKLSDMNKNNATKNPNDLLNDSDIVEVPVEKKKIEVLTISDDEIGNINDDDDDDYDDSELIATLKNIMNSSPSVNEQKNVDEKNTEENSNVIGDPSPNVDDEETILLNSLKMLEELIEDPTLE